MKKVVLIISIIAILFTLIGCSSIQALIRSSIEEKPIWVYEPQVSRDQIAFVGTGSASNEPLSQVLSYESILVQLSQYIGKDIKEQYISELSERQTIEDYQIKITREFTKRDGDLFITHYLAVADKKIIDSNRSELLLQIEQTQETIDQIEALSSKEMRADQDFNAALHYLEIAKLSKTIVGELGEKTYADAIKKVVSILENLRIKFLAEESTSTSYLFIVQRGDRSISPKIQTVPLSVAFTSSNGANGTYLDKQKIMTNKVGRAQFTNTNPLMLQTGNLRVSIDVSSLSSYYSALNGEDVKQIQAIIEKNSISVPYSRVMKINKKNVLLAIGEYSIKGELLQTTYVGDALVAPLIKEGVSFTSIHPLLTTDNDDEIFFDLIGNQFSTGSLLYGKVGIETTKKLSDSYAVSVAGSISLYSIPSFTMIGTTYEVKAVGTGESEQEAIEKAFSQFGNISVSLIKRVLYE